MKKNGFIFVETIVAIVVLTSSLLLLYSTFTKVLQSEKTRVYYDDVSYIYRTHYIKERLNELNLNSAIKDITVNNDKFFVTIGMEYDTLFDDHETEKDYIGAMLQDFEVKQIIIIKENKLDNLKNCTIECSMDASCYEYENCNGMYTSLSEEMINYLRTVFVDVECTYIMAIEYVTCEIDNTNCKNYYGWVSV